MELLLIGTSHHAAPVEVREKVSFNDEEIGRFLIAMGQERFINECLLLSTCNSRAQFACLVEQNFNRQGLFLNGYLSSISNT